MTNLKNLEIINIYTDEGGKLRAMLSFQNPLLEENDLNNGYGLADVPINIRPLKLSSRGNILVNQSEQIQEEIPTISLKGNGYQDQVF